MDTNKNNKKYTGSYDKSTNQSEIRAKVHRCVANIY